MSTTIQLHVESNRQRLLDELFELLRIPSISTLPEHKADVERAAEFIASRMGEAGLENIEVISTDRHPLIYADWLHAPGKPTVLCYGHYDVQPVDPLDEWKSPPFEPTIRNGSIYARGAADDKGQMYMHIKAVEALHAVHGKLPVNVKFLIEGEEEVGGESISAYVPAHKDKLEADAALISDTSMYAPNMPTLNIGLRGMIYMGWRRPGPPAICTRGSTAARRRTRCSALVECSPSARTPTACAGSPASMTTSSRRPGGKRELGAVAV